MKKIFGLAVLAVAAALSVATPAYAEDFTGPRIGATVGLAGDDFASDDVTTYGANVGYDLAVADGVIAGVTIEYQDSSDTGRDLSAVARLGAKVTDDVLVYALGGYTNIGVDGLNVTFDGYRVGGGLEVAVTSGLYLNAEYRYSDYSDINVDAYQGVVGIGYRF